MRRIGFFLASIIAYTAFLSPVWASTLAIQTTAEQDIRFMIADPVVKPAYRAGGYLSNYTGVNMDGRYYFASSTNFSIYPINYADTTTCYPLTSTTTFNLAWYESGSSLASMRYKNQSGTERTVTLSTRMFTVAGQTIKFSSGNRYTGTDTCAKDLRFSPAGASKVYFMSVEEMSLSSIDTQAELYAYMDQLNSEFYARYYTPTDPSASEIFAIITPESGTTTGSTSVNFNISFYNANAGTQVDQFNIFLFDRIRSTTLSYDVDLPAGEYGVASTTIALPASTYTASISLFASTSPDLLRSTKNVTFNVNYNPAGTIGVGGFGDLSGVATSTCDILNISGCVQNALLFMFYPSETILDNFAELKTLIASKPPFGYIAVYTTQLSALSSAGSATFDLADEDNIKTLIFDPISNGLSYILWVCFGFWIFHRVRKQEL